MATKIKLDYTINEKTQCFEVISHAVKANGYIRANGYKPIPEGLCVRHTCDNRRCVNPAHLVLGTAQDNSQDMVDRKRSGRGAKNTMAKLTLTEAKEIKLEHTLTVAEISEKYNLSHQELRDIKAGIVWKELDEVKPRKAIRAGAKINANIARKILSLKGIKTYKQIMLEFNIKKSMVYNIWSNISWKT